MKKNKKSIKSDILKLIKEIDAEKVKEINNALQRVKDKYGLTTAISKNVDKVGFIINIQEVRDYYELHKL